MNISILGSGLIGSAMAKDLSKDQNLEVIVSDVDEKSLKQFDKLNKILAVKADLSCSLTLNETIKNSDLVINALPGFMGFKTLKAIIEAKKNVVDISFASENCMQLDTLAKTNDVLAVIDSGVAPGMSNMLVARGYHTLDEVEFAKIYVGGLPLLRKWPYEYKAGFSPIDVIEEYTRPVFYINNGEVIEKEALSEIELIDFDEIGTLEAFNTDGLRSLSKTMKIPNMVEKTLRYPGHAEKMKILRESGFFSRQLININGAKIRPIDLTSKLLFPMWKLENREIDITIMKVIVSGKKCNKDAYYECTLKDVYDASTNIHSMARTTGYTATMVARLIINQLIDKKGVIPPEMIGKNKELMKFVFEGLKDRGVIYKEKLV